MKELLWHPKAEGMLPLLYSDGKMQTEEKGTWSDPRWLIPALNAHQIYKSNILGEPGLM